MQSGRRLLTGTMNQTKYDEEGGYRYVKVDESGEDVSGRGVIIRLCV